PSQHEEEGDRKQVQQPDPLVIARQQPAPHGVAGVQVVVFRWEGRNGVHDLGLSSSRVSVGRRSGGGCWSSSRGGGAGRSLPGGVWSGPVSPEAGSSWSPRPSDLISAMSWFNPSSLICPSNDGMIGE